MATPKTYEGPSASLEAESDFVKVSRAMWKRNIEILEEFIRIPNKSPAFDKNWKENGHMDRAVALLVQYIEEQKPHVKGLSYEVIEHEGRTPLLLITAEGTAPGNTLMYGHLDKQPEGGAWRDGLDPWTPVEEGDRLYGRGGADDGYALFAALTSLRILDEKGIPRPTTQIIIEAAEESGSTDLPYYLDFLGDRITEPDLVVCLDSETKDYDRLWETTSLRGVVNLTLDIEVLRGGESVHSGKASGIVPDPTLVFQQLLSRVVDPKTQEVLLPELQTDIPPERFAEAKAVAELLGPKVWEEFPIPGGHGVTQNPVDAILNSTWRPTVVITGVSGLPRPEDAGNAIHGKVTYQISVRIPPGVNAKEAAAALKRTLENAPPHGSKTKVTIIQTGDGWIAPESSDALKRSIADASEKHMGAKGMVQGTGGSIPFMAMLGEKFPRAEFLITGVLGPGSNAHGPNEFLDVSYAAKLTAAIAQILADRGKIPQSS